MARYVKPRTVFVVTVVHRRDRSTGVAYAWWFPLGIFGAHQYYLGRPGRGTLYLFTAGIFLIGWLWDAVTLPTQVRKVNARGW